MHLNSIGTGVSLAILGAGVGYASTYNLASERNEHLPYAGAAAAAATASGAFLRSSMMKHPAFMAWGGLVTGLGAGALGGIAMGAFPAN